MPGFNHASPATDVVRRVGPGQSLTYLRKTFAHSDFTSGTGKIVGKIPAGALIAQAVIRVTTAFDATTSNLLELGDSGDADRLVATVDETTVGGYGPAAAGLGYRYTVDTDILLEYTWSGAKTAGAVEALVVYIPEDVQTEGNNQVA